MPNMKEIDANDAGKRITWNAELEKQFILTLMAQDNEDLSVKDWKEIAKKMKPLGFSTMACKKQWGRIRKEYLTARDAESGTATAGSKKRKAETAKDDAKSKKKARGKNIVPKESAAAAVMEEDDNEDIDDDEVLNE